MDGTNQTPLIAWELICRPMKEGGLGVKNCKAWNEAALAKLVWNITNKADNLGVKWVNHMYIKGENWWEYKAPINSC